MRIKEKVGDLVIIPFSDTHHTYGRVLIDKSYAIYDCPSQADRDDFDAIIKSDILFTAYVESEAIKRGHWKIVTNIPLEGNLKKFYPRYFNPCPTNPECLRFYEVYQEEIEAAIQKDWIKTGRIQLHGIYSRGHIADRVNAWYEGKKYPDNEQSILLFKKMTGLL